MPGIVLWKETAKYEKPNFAKAMVLMGKTRYYDENLLAETEQHSLVTKFFSSSVCQIKLYFERKQSSQKNINSPKCG